MKNQSPDAACWTPYYEKPTSFSSLLAVFFSFSFVITRDAVPIATPLLLIIYYLFCRGCFTLAV